MALSKMDSLFDDFYSNQQNQNSNLNKSKEILVTFAEYKSTETVNPDTLFQNFDEIHVITYSLGIEQVERIMKYFKRGQVIIGSYKSISGDVAEMLALQKYTVDYISQNNYLQKMIESKTFRFFVTDKVHAKIYLLKSDDGRYRVILSSANFSANAWQKRQVENFVVIDDLAVYESYTEFYEDIKRGSTDEIDINARPLKEDGTNLEYLPALRCAVHSKTAVVIHEQPPESQEACEYVFAQIETAKKLRDILQKANVKTNSEGQTLLLADNFIKMRKTMKESHEEKQRRNEEKNSTYPALILDYEKQSATFNDKLWNLNPSSDEVKSDLENLVKYVDGTEIFTGDIPSLKTIYWKVIIYMFVSPFFAQLRYTYDKIVPANSTGKAHRIFLKLTENAIH